MKPRIVILGGGISGLSAAYRFVKAGCSVELIESKNVVGGLAGTIKNHGIEMEYGPHAFSSEKEEILEFIFDLLDNKVRKGTRDVKLYMQDQYLKYPLRAEDIIFKLGPITAFNVVVLFLLEKLDWRKSNYGPFGPNMEQWSIRQFGKGLHNLFFRPYTEQFWNVSCAELSPSCIPTYKNMSFWKTARTLLLSRKRKDNLSIIEREKLTLYYPENGFGTICTSMAERINGTGLAKIHLGTSLSSVYRNPDNSYVITAINQDGDLIEMQPDYLISTIPISSLANAFISEIPDDVIRAANNLHYLSLVSLYIITEKQNALGCMYQYCLNRPYNRIADVNRCTLTPPGSRKLNAISIEKSCRYGDDWWSSSKEEIFERYFPFLEKDGILERKDVVDLEMVKASHAYPMPIYDYKSNLSIVKEFVSQQENLHLLGRTGTFRYADSDQTMESAFNLADKLIDNN